MGPASQAIDITTFRGSKDGSIIPSQFSQGPLKGDQVLLKITHSGLCGTDEHYRDKDQVLGHEGAGVVEDIGPDVQKLKKGDNVGFGYLHDSCGNCQECLTGHDIYCPDRKIYGNSDFHMGSMASHAVWRESFLFKIPSSIPNEYAAPLMCAGATVFAALEMHGVRPTDRVGIIGVGGLGHLAIQFASKMGCEVVVFSGTDSKESEAKKLGAMEFYPTKGVKELKIGKPIDFLLVTTSAQPDWALYLNVLRPGATVLPLSVAPGNLEIPCMQIILNGFRVQGSLVAPRPVHRKMLQFAAVHEIRPIIETFPMDKEGIQKAFEHLDQGTIRYRGVLVAP